MSNKPTIPAEVADAIEKARFSHWDNERIAYYVLNPDHTATGLAPLRSIPFDMLLAALVNGYEREMTEEERTHAAIKREWIDRDSRRQRNAYCDGFADGIEFVLGEISMLIEGVNA